MKRKSIKGLTLLAVSIGGALATKTIIAYLNSRKDKKDEKSY